MPTDVEPRLGVTEAGPEAAYQGENLTLHATVREVPTGEVPEADEGTRGNVTFRVNGTTVGSVPVAADGNVTLRTTLPGATTLGKQRVQAVYSGTEGTARAAAGTTALQVKDRPLVVNVTAPEPAEVANASTSLVVRFQPESVDEGITEAVARIDAGPWRAADAMSSHRFGLSVDVCSEGLDDGFHNLTARLDDNTGQTATETVSFVVDCDSTPTMNVTEPEPRVVQPDRRVVVADNGTVAFGWSGSEPVAVRANITTLETPEPAGVFQPVIVAFPNPFADLGGVAEAAPVDERFVGSPAFVENGSIRLELDAPGVYKVELSAIDTARNRLPSVDEDPMQGFEKGPYTVVVPPS
jgi:hypothetical protein